MFPNGQRLTFQYGSRTASGYPNKLRHYRSRGCSGCPFREKCTRAAGNRELRVNMPFDKAKLKAKEPLLSEVGKQQSIRRMVEVESVFGQIKHNRGFRRCLRGDCRK